MGMDGGYGGYDPGYGGGGYDPIDFGGLGQLLDPIISPGFDPDPGPVERSYEPYDPGYGGYNPGYTPPTYHPPYSPPTPPRNSLPSPGPQQSPTPPSNRRMPKPTRPGSTPGYRVLPEGARPAKPGALPTNPVPSAPTKPSKNEPAAPAVHPLTRKEIDKISDLNDKQTQKFKTQALQNKLTGDSVKSSVDGLLPKLPQDDKDAVQKAIESGKPEDVSKALEGKGVDPKAAEALGAMAAVNQKVDELAKSNDLTQKQLQDANKSINDLKGQVSSLTNSVNQQQQQIAQQNQQIQGLTNAINQQQQQIAQQGQQINQLAQQNAQQAQQIQQLANGLNAARAQINNLTQAVNGLIRAQLLAGILQRAQPGVRQVPSGPTVIVRVPGMLPPGAVAPMGNGAVLAGPPMGERGPQPPYAGPTSITTGSVLEAMGMPQAIGPAVKNSSAGVTSGIVLVNKADALVGFMVDGKTYSLEPAYFQAFRGAAAGTVSFDKGTGETAKYQVTSGTYEFTATEQGWELYRKTYKATIDNSHNPSDFRFVQGTQTLLVPAGESKELTGAYPIGVRFDDGTGNIKEKRLLDGNYAVASTGEEGQLDLFDPKNLAESEPATVASVEPLPANHELAQLIEEASPMGDSGALEALSGISQEEREQATSSIGKQFRKAQLETSNKVPQLLIGE